MTIAVTGGTGRVGHFFVQAARAEGRAVAVMSRRGPVPFDLDGPPPPLDGVETLVHAALDHLPGRYRGGEGADEAAFLRRNVEGSARLFEAARRAGVARIVFLSSRAVYDGHPAGAVLADDARPLPTTAYGRAKAEGEAALAAALGPATRGIALRATGVYGPPPPGRAHKWAALFDRFLAGEALPPRVGTEVHGADVVQAARVALSLARPGQVAAVNVSDLVLDRRDLLARVRDLTGRGGPLPDAADATGLRRMDCARLLAAGWRPGGMARLDLVLRGLLGPPRALAPRAGTA